MRMCTSTHTHTPHTPALAGLRLLAAPLLLQLVAVDADFDPPLVVLRSGLESDRGLCCDLRACAAGLC